MLGKNIRKFYSVVILVFLFLFSVRYVHAQVSGTCIRGCYQDEFGVWHADTKGAPYCEAEWGGNNTCNSKNGSAHCHTWDASGSPWTCGNLGTWPTCTKLPTEHDECCPSGDASPPPEVNCEDDKWWGPSKIMSGSSVLYFVPAYGKSPYTCNWSSTPSVGRFSPQACSTFVTDYGGVSGRDKWVASAAYAVLNYNGDVRINMRIAGTGSETCDTDVDVYNCDWRRFQDATVDGNNITPGGTYIIEAHVGGPSGPPLMEYNLNPVISGTNNPCGVVTAGNGVQSSNRTFRFTWQAPSTIGLTCDLNISVTADPNSRYPAVFTSTAYCAPFRVIIPGPPDCSVLTFTSPAPLNICSVPSTTATIRHSHTQPLNITLSSTCADGAVFGNGVGSTINNVPSNTNTAFTWQPPRPIGSNASAAASWNANSAGCSFSVTMVDQRFLASPVTCNNIGNTSLSYNYNLVVDVDETEDNCATGTPSDGASVTISGKGSVTTGSNGIARFNNVTPSGTPLHTYDISVSKPFACSPWSLKCPHDGGNDYTSAFPPIICGDTYSQAYLVEGLVSSWYTAIDADLFADNNSTSIECADVSGPSDVFDRSTLQFSGHGNINDAYAIVRDDILYNTDDGLCDSGDNCGAALFTSYESEWYDNIFTFKPPSHGNIIISTDFTELEENGAPHERVFVMTVDNFNSSINSGPLNYRLPGGGAILYITGEDDVRISNPIYSAIGGVTLGRLLIVAETDINISSSVGYSNINDYEPDAQPNIEAGIITKGTINIEGNPSGTDIPLMILGPVAAQNISIDRDLGTDNDEYPAVSFKYYPSYLWRFSEMQRDNNHCGIDYTGLTLFDVQFDYKD